MRKLFHAFAVAIFSFCFATAAPAEERDNANLEGTWFLSVQRGGGLPPGISFHTYTARGGAVGTSNSTAIGPTHGNWVKAGDGRFTATFWAFRIDAERQHIGYNLISLNIQLVGPDEYRSVHLVETYDLVWNRLSSRFDTGYAKRLPVVHFPQQP